MESYIDKDGLFRYGIRWKSAIGLTLVFNAFIGAGQPGKVPVFKEFELAERTGGVKTFWTACTLSIYSLLNFTEGDSSAVNPITG
jgi:hypothetical protein